MKTTVIGSGLVAAMALAGAAFADTSPTATEKFAEMDINTDGAVTVAEYTAYAGAAGFNEDEAELQFAVMAGDDGVLAIEELEAIMEVEKNASDWEESESTEMDDGEAEVEAEITLSDDTASES
ncbi:MAG: hypothetical protein MRY64_05370 [Hyphomonadaceae bacterium]|nr:hypothetical protein [Hyphomonadaceae bacterium]